MNKRTSQRQWLNFVIILISALILVFMLIGRFMNRAADETNIQEAETISQAQPAIKLIKIDFGIQKIIYRALEKGEKWHSEWIVEPDSSLSIKQIDRLVARWQEVLEKPLEQSFQQDAAGYRYNATVLLYFDGTNQPLVVKVASANDNNQAQSLLIDFVSTGQRVVLKDFSLYQLIPKPASQNELLEKSFSEKQK